MKAIECKKVEPTFKRGKFLLMSQNLHNADEAFVTGTFAGLTPVVEFDGAPMGDGKRGPMVERLQLLYQERIRSECNV